MAVKKKATKRRKTGAPKRKRKSVKGLPLTLAFGGVNFRKKACSSTKTDAKKMAEAARAKGKNARVKQDPMTKRHCVFVRG